MIKLIKPFLLLLLLLAATAIPAAAKTITLAWDPSPSPGIAGYNLYYQENTSAFPFNGTSLPEGASPILLDGPNSTSQTLNLPDDGSIYYFTITAVSDAGQESSFSNIVATEWIPLLLAPTNSAAVGTAASFVWNQPPVNFKPSTSIVSFDLIYGTDPNLDENAMAVVSPGTFNSNWPQFKFNVAVPLAILLFLLMAIRTGRVKRFWHPVRIGFCIGIFVLQASCGGGGGGDSEIPSTSVPDTSVPDTSVPDTSVPDTIAPAPSPLFTDVVTDIYATEYQITDLQPNTQYYWKVVAVDNFGITYESIAQKFATLSH